MGDAAHSTVLWEMLFNAGYMDCIVPIRKVKQTLYFIVYRAGQN